MDNKFDEKGAGSNAEFETGVNNPSNFRHDESLTPSENLSHLLSILSKYNMELETMDDLPNKMTPSLRIMITGVIMKGNPGIVAHSLYKIRPAFLKYFSNYVVGPSPIIDKHYELSRCKCLVAEFLYEINYSDPNLIDPNAKYVVHFINHIDWAPTEFKAVHLELDNNAVAEVQQDPP